MTLAAYSWHLNSRAGLSYLGVDYLSRAASGFDCKRNTQLVGRNAGFISAIMSKITPNIR